MHARDGAKHVVGVDAELVQALQFVGEHVEQHFGIGFGVDVTQIVFEQFLLELRGVGQVAVVRERDAVGRIDVERLRLGGGRHAGSRIAHMTDAHATAQVDHVTGVEHVAHQAIGLAQVQAAVFVGGDAGGVLATVLEHGQAVVQLLIDGGLGDHADDSAHARYRAWNN